MFVRVKDPDTGHEFDVDEDHFWITEGLVKMVSKKHYPPCSRPRPVKHNPLLGKRRSRAIPADNPAITTTVRSKQTNQTERKEP